jgi:hypothetical protein
MKHTLTSSVTLMPSKYMPLGPDEQHVHGSEHQARQAACTLTVSRLDQNKISLRQICREERWMNIPDTSKLKVWYHIGLQQLLQ